MAEPSSKFTIPQGEFESWLTPPEALEMVKEVGDYGLRCDTLVERLAAGLARSAVETYRRQRYGEEVDRKECMLIPRTVWDDSDLHSLHSLWDTGQFKFKKHQYPTDITHSFFGVRFEPEGLAGMLKAAGVKTAALPVVAESTKDERKPPAPAELKRFRRAILSEWPDAAEDWIREKAVLFFPDNRIRRDPFREILREIRGPTLPGKKRKIEY